MSRSACPLAFATALSISVLGAAADAQPQPVATPTPRDGTILRPDRDLFVIDLGASDGYVVGGQLRVHRPILIRHPITGRMIRDQYPIATLTLRSVGAEVSLAAVDTDGLRAPAVGDVLRPLDAPAAPAISHPISVSLTPPARPPPRATPTAAPAPRAATQPTAPTPTVQQAPGLDPEAIELLNNFLASLGTSLSLRIERYTAFLRQHPQSRYELMLRQEMARLHAIESAAHTPTATTAQAPPTAPPPPTVHVEEAPPLITSPSNHFREGQRPELVFQLDADASYTLLFHVRRRATSAYRTARLTRERGGVFRHTLERAWMTAPGIEYFVEYVGRDGRSHDLIGSGEGPVVLTVDPPPVARESSTGLSRIDLRAEYADVGSRTVGVIQRQQHFSLVEGDFFQRTRIPALYGYRVGFGVFSATGIALSEVMSEQPSTSSRVVYGYHELEFGVSSFVHIITRLQVGVQNEGLVVGFQGRLRLGDERRTNVVLGGDILGGVGQKAFFTLYFHPIARLPMAAGGEVFQQVVGGDDLMFRALLQVGWRVRPWVTLGARGSYQLRNIQNGGFGLGLATTFEW